MMYKEIWKKIPEYKDYIISNMGQVASLKFGKKRLLKSNLNHFGHRRVGIGKISTLVLLAFVGPCPKGKETSHLNGNKIDDRLENLAWETYKQNQQRRALHGTDNKGERNGKATLKSEDIIIIKELYKQGFVQEKIGRMFNIGQKQISRIIRNKSWNHIYV